VDPALASTGTARATTRSQHHHRRLREALCELPPLDNVPSVGLALRQLFDAGLLELPLPAAGDTRERFLSLLELGAHDLSLARLAEGHADAVAILSEAGRTPQAGALYGVWTARSKRRALRAECTPRGWMLSGEVPFCSGARSIDRALVVAHLPEPMLFDIARSSLGCADLEGWRAIGMGASDSGTVALNGCEIPVDALVGAPGFHTARGGFWAGALGVAACWFGGAVGAYRAWQRALADEPRPEPHARAHLGAAFASLSAAGQVLHDAAHAIDAGEGAHALQRRALWTRHIVERTCVEVLDRMGRAVGPSPMVFDAIHARRVADLPIYLRESRAERDLAALGELVEKAGGSAWL